MEEIKRTDTASMGQRRLLRMFVVLMAFFMLLFTGCSGSSGSGDDSDSISSSDSTSSDASSSDATSSDTEDSETDIDVSELDVDYDAGDYTWDSSEEIQITLNGTSISVSGGDAVVSGSEVTIGSAGTYRVSGSLSDGRIVVDTEDTQVVRLVFDGIDIHCSESAPVYIASAERTAIILEGDDNYLEDAATYVYEGDEDEPNAALHSKSYLTIGGSGALTVTGNYKDGITGKDGLVINSGTVTVTSVDDGIRGKDYIVVKDATLNVTTTGTGDGLLSDNDENTERGYILIEAGTFNIDAREDAIQAETYVLVYDGVFSLTSGGGAGTSFSDEDSKKGIKGLAGVQIDGGDFSIDSADDGVHSNGAIVLNDGVFDIATGDDAMHADTLLETYGGDVSITDSYEGLESAVIRIDDGNFYIVSSDDGVNVAGGNDGSGGFTPAASGDYHLYIDGGYIAIYSDGDSLDSNGSIEMTGGTVLAHGPSDDNAALDYNSSFVISGGFLMTAGGTGMGGQSPSATSTQNYKTLTFDQKSADTLFHIESSDGTDLVTFRPSKKYSCALVSSPDLESGTTYKVYFGGSYSGGTETDGLYEGGTYSGGTQEASLSFSL